MTQAIEKYRNDFLREVEANVEEGDWVWVTGALNAGFDGIMLMGCKTGDDYATKITEIGMNPFRGF